MRKLQGIRSATLIGIAFGVASLPQAFAASYVVPTDRELVTMSPVIVTASALASHTELRDGRIETITNFSIDEVMKGSIHGDTIDVYEPGGVYNRRVTMIPGVPRFVDGGRYLLFLTRAGGVWRVWNLALGKFAFDTDNRGRDVVMRDTPDLYGWDSDRSVHVERRRLAEPFLQFIRATIAGGPAKSDYAVPAEPLIGQTEPKPFTHGKLKLVPLAFTADSYSYFYNGTTSARWCLFPSAVTFVSVSTEPQAASNGITAMNTALAAWNGDANSNVNLVNGGTAGSTAGVTASDGVNAIAFEQDLNACCGAGTLPCGAMSYGPGLLGVGGVTADLGTHIGPAGITFYTSSEGDVQMNKVTNPCTLLFSSGDFNSAVTHETGHTLGFRHSDEIRTLGGGACMAPLDCSTSAIMKAFIPSGINAVLQTWDHSAVAAVYPNPTGNVPGTLTATAATSTSVAVSWGTAAGATSYHVYRTANNKDWIQIATPVGTSITDSTVAANTAYLYRVRSFDGNNESADSNVDLATTVIFTNPTLTAGVTTVQAVDFTELRTAVNAVRALAGLTPFSFTVPAPANGVTVLAAHITDLRTALDLARSMLGLSAVVYNDPTITAQSTFIRAVHITDLRGGVQ